MTCTHIQEHRTQKMFGPISYLVQNRSKAYCSSSKIICFKDKFDTNFTELMSKRPQKLGTSQIMSAMFVLNSILKWKKKKWENNWEMFISLNFSGHFELGSQSLIPNCTSVLDSFGIWSPINLFRTKVKKTNIPILFKKLLKQFSQSEMLPFLHLLSSFQCSDNI